MPAADPLHDPETVAGPGSMVASAGSPHMKHGLDGYCPGESGGAAPA
jgi:hypothetical protein